MGLEKEGACIEDSFGSRCELSKRELASSGCCPSMLGVGYKDLPQFVVEEEDLLEALMELRMQPSLALGGCL